VARIIEASPQGVAMGEVLAAADLVLVPELMLTEGPTLYGGSNVPDNWRQRVCSSDLSAL